MVREEYAKMSVSFFSDQSLYFHNVQRLKIQNSNLAQKILRQINQFAIITNEKVGFMDFLLKYYESKISKFLHCVQHRIFSYPRQS